MVDKLETYYNSRNFKSKFNKIKSFFRRGGKLAAKDNWTFSNKLIEIIHS